MPYCVIENRLDDRIRRADEILMGFLGQLHFVLPFKFGIKKCCMQFYFRRESGQRERD